MGLNRGQIKSIVRTNLDDAGISFYNDNDLNESIQDSYDDIACFTQCISKSISLFWQANLSYYNFVSLGISDYLGTTAIFNSVTNRWLRDDLNLRDFDRLRRDWETWQGTPQFWAPSDPLNIALCPKYIDPNTGRAFDQYAFSSAFYIGSLNQFGQFKLFYWALAPTLVDDNSTFLIASDMQNLLEFYVTADMLEQAEEFVKAAEYFEKYFNGVQQYAARVKAINKSDLLLRV
jgi:hypothetical protein